ncbi:YmiA family putative membrane protein, partial [Klebsiella pneumoniae]
MRLAMPSGNQEPRRD